MDHLEIIPNICRVCLHIKDNKISLYKKVNGFSPYEKLLKFTKLCVKVDDGGSSWICLNCAQELDTVAEFMNKCDQTNKILYNYLNVAKDSTSINFENECEINDNEPTDGNTMNEEHVQAQESHTRNQKGVPARQECPMAGCHKSFTTKTNLLTYIRKHNDSTSIHCEDECEIIGNEPTDGNTVYGEYDQENELYTRKQRGVPARQECPVLGCHKSFTTKTNLLTHIRKHNGERPFSCSECSKTFRSKNTLTNHMRIHTGVKPYMCATCGKRFATNKVRAHMRSHGARSLACPQCARTFTHTRALALHARTHAPPTRPYRCALCPRAYNHKQSLNKHVRKRHVTQKLTTE